MRRSKELFRIFRAYNVKLVPVPRIPTGMSIPNSRLGVGCDPGAKMVFVNQKKQKYEGLVEREELVLHELCHIVVQPPKLDIAKVPELAILLPFEHALLKQHLPEHLVKGRDFQYGTDLRVRHRGDWYRTFGDMRTGESPDYPVLPATDEERAKTREEYDRRVSAWKLSCYQHPLFLEGVELCKRLGLLNDKGEVNLGKYPNWNRGTRRAFLKHMKRCRQQSPPQLKKKPPQDLADIARELRENSPLTTGMDPV